MFSFFLSGFWSGCSILYWLHSMVPSFRSVRWRSIGVLQWGEKNYFNFTEPKRPVIQPHFRHRLTATVLMNWVGPPCFLNMFLKFDHRSSTQVLVVSLVVGFVNTPTVDPFLRKLLGFDKLDFFWCSAQWNATWGSLKWFPLVATVGMVNQDSLPLSLCAPVPYSDFFTGTFLLCFIWKLGSKNSSSLGSWVE